LKVFEYGKIVMEHLRKDRFPKLKYKKIGSCKILRKIYDNAYKMDLLKPLIFLQYLIFLTYMIFVKEKQSGEVSTMEEWEGQLLVNPAKEIEEILSKRVSRKNQGQGYFEYLVKWKNINLNDAS
jgi:hypothetical protein